MAPCVPSYLVISLAAFEVFEVVARVGARHCAFSNHPLTTPLSCRRRDESRDTPRIACESGNRVVSILVSLI
ncbi:hypothetical protein Scep_003932 [Stephania cephalantha]|uniref:Uncharacterized protein n=1 Tax=Stephania cephalantha TaxID=152367 RepID=A0AAP0PUY2_9MAGN